MEELKNIKTYQELKKALETELYNQAEGFVRTGYLLKVARDTDILRESGYATVAEFAHAEYGLTKDVVSRYIAINDRYSEGGYSERLQQQYQGYGVAKLQDMLTLPDAIIEVMSPEMTRKDIQEVKREYREEESNPMAGFMETPKKEQQDMTILQQAMHQYLYDNREEFTKGFDIAMKPETGDEEAVNGILDAFAPSGVGIKTVRIQGTGRVIISFRGKDAEVEVLNVRTQECRSYTWQQFIQELRAVFLVEADESGEEAWERIYGEEYREKKEAVAPVQLPEETAGQQDTPRTFHDSQPEIPAETKVEGDTVKDREEEPAAAEEQIPGQDNILNHPEYLPGDWELQNNAAGADTAGGMPEDTNPFPESGLKAAGVETEKPGNPGTDSESGKETAPEETEAAGEAGEIWMEVRASGRMLEEYMKRWRGKENLMEDDVLENIYRNAIDLAAGLEKIKIIRSRKNGKEHNA